MLSSPLDVCLGITSKCNLNCQHCLASSTRQNLDLTTIELLGIIDQLAAAKVFRLNIFGGEPLMQPDFFKIVKRIRKYPMRISLNTNGTLIDKATAKKLADNKISSFCVSLDGSTAEVMDKVRGRGAFDSCLTGIKHLLQYRANIMLSATLTHYNLHDIRNMVLFAKSLGVKNIRFNHLFYGGNAACFIDKVMVTPEEELAAVREVYGLFQEFGGFVTGSYQQQKEKIDKLKDFTPQKDKVIANACGAATNRCNIRPDGKVTPCEVIWDLEVGDLRKQTFSEIWRNSPILNELRWPKEVSLKDKPDCQGCQYQYMCFIGHRCSPYYYPRGLEDKSLYCWKGVDLEKVYSACGK